MIYTRVGELLYPRKAGAWSALQTELCLLAERAERAIVLSEVSLTFEEDVVQENHDSVRAKLRERVHHLPIGLFPH